MTSRSCTALFSVNISTHTLTWSVTGSATQRAAIGAISTHTLTWSVTSLIPDDFLRNIISTHTLTWSVTRTRQAVYKDVVNFNSHAHVERDVTPSYVAVTSAISTHTLTWSVTQGGACCFCNEDISTHTLTWSVTQKNICRTLIKSFQLTRSRGA